MCGILVAEGDIPKLRYHMASIKHRGPDNFHMKVIEDPNHKITMGFHRLAIQDVSDHGNQPFYHAGRHLVCNGEIYNHKEISSKIDYTPSSSSDCEILLPAYTQLGIEALTALLDAEFAFVLYDPFVGLIAARDPIGIRPLFYGYHSDDKIAFASEAKALEWCYDARPFPPGHYYDGKKFVQYTNVARSFSDEESEDALTEGIRVKLTAAVQKRLQSDVPVGFLLSGGLDSSIVCAIASKLTGKKIKTFSIGMNENPIDLKYARIVADHIGSEHHEFTFNKWDVEDVLKDVIHHTETWDITTIRASIGMYLLCQKIWEETDVKVLLTGEVSDELFGYKYTDFAPNPEEFQKEAIKRIEELYLYDVLRADRCISAHGMEARVPFGDKEFVRHVMSIPPAMKMIDWVNNTGHGKYLLRKAFEDYLPKEILWREKAAFSDAVGHGMVDHLKEMAQKKYRDDQLEDAINEVSDSRYYDRVIKPISKEALMYLMIFRDLFPSREDCLIKDYWMPNKEWPGCDVDDPSARVLSNYGNSGK